MTIDWRKYVLTLVITAAIFATAFYIASRFDAARIAEIRATEEKISLDILSTETQYDLLGELDCETIRENPVLSSELNTLASQLSVAEGNLGSDNPQVVTLKKQYSLLEIKDYILLQKVSQKCGIRPVHVFYFYSNEPGECPDCDRAGDVLTYLREQYPDLRVYSFDYNLDLSALETLIDLKGVRDELPAFIINNRRPVYGFKNLEEMEKLIPELKTLATTTASSSR